MQTHIPPGSRWCNPQKVSTPTPFIPTSQKRPRYALNKATDPATCTECGSQYSCRNTAVLHMVNKHGFKRADALWNIKFPHEPPPPDIPPEPPPPPLPPPPDTTLPRPNSPKAKPHPFACSMCKRTFPLQNGLTRRLRYMHNATCPVPERKRPRADDPIASEESAFPCDKCDMIARSKTGLKSHIRAKHPENPTKDAPRPQLIPQPASLRCEFCLRDFGNIGGLACHKKFKHPPGTPILPATIQVTFPRNKKRQRDTSPPPEREDREKVQCGVCQKFYAHLDSLVIHCRKFHEGEGLPPKTNSTNAKYKATKTRDLP
ncbi:Tbingi protein, partial [Trypanosoma theileri]